MKPLQYYKKQIFIMGCLGMFPMLVFAQETLSSANALHGEDEVAGAEEEAEEHTGNVGIFFSTEFVFHGYFSFRGGDAALVRAVPKMIVVTKKPAAPSLPSPARIPCTKGRTNGTHRT